MTDKVKLNFATPVLTRTIIDAIVRRALRENLVAKDTLTDGRPDVGSDVDLNMTLCALYNHEPSTINSVSLCELLGSGDFDFVHDVYGLLKHMDRARGALTDCFSPRCAR